MLGHRWQQSRWLDTVWTAKLPNFVDDSLSIRIELEMLSSGATEVKITRGGKGIPIDPVLYPSLEEAASASVKAIRKYFAGHRHAALILPYLPYRTNHEVANALGASVQSVAGWHTRGLMSRANVTTATRMMGIFSKATSRAEGLEDTCYLESPSWERNPVDNLPPV